MTDSGGVRLQHEPDKAKGAETLSLDPHSLPPESLDINVKGRDLAPPEEGFGQLWSKRFRVALAGADVTPIEVVRVWRERFSEFWPESSRFYRPLGGLEPGQVALADLEMAPGTRLSTGVVVIDVQPTSFTFVTPRGHSFAGYITFSANDCAGTTVAQVDIRMRATDPLFELFMPLGGHARENGFWKTTLSKLVDHFGVEGQEPEMDMTLLDPHRQWGKATNIIYNSYLHTGFYMLTLPFRKLIGWRKARGGGGDRDGQTGERNAA